MPFFIAKIVKFGNIRGGGLVMKEMGFLDVLLFALAINTPTLIFVALGF